MSIFKYAGEKTSGVIPLNSLSHFDSLTFTFSPIFLKDAKCIVPIFTNEAKNLFPVRSLTFQWDVDVTHKNIRQEYKPFGV